MVNLLYIFALVAVPIALVYWVIRRGDREQEKYENVTFVCRSCESFYAGPGAPVKCRTCGGNVELFRR